MRDFEFYNPTTTFFGNGVIDQIGEKLNGIYKSCLLVSAKGPFRESGLYDRVKTQLEKAGCPERAELPFHKMILEKKLPYTIGGGIGQSRLCMLLLGRAHVGEVQASIWPDEMRETCAQHRIFLL